MLKKLSRNQRYEENKDAEKLSRKQHYESYNNLIVTKNKKSTYMLISLIFTAISGDMAKRDGGEGE